MLLAGGLLLVSSTWGSASRSPVERGPDTKTRAARSHERGLHDLAADVLLPEPSHTRAHEDLRRLRSELASLAADLDAARKDGSETRLGALEDRRAAAQAAFSAFRGRLSRTGGAELAVELEALAAPLWSEIDAGLASQELRAERLSSARARVDAAVAGPRSTHGSTFTTLTFEAEE